MANQQTSGTICGFIRYFRTNKPMEGRTMSRTNLLKNGFSEALPPIKVNRTMCKWPNINETVDMAEVERKEFHGHDRGLNDF